MLAIACGLARGFSVDVAVRDAKAALDLIKEIRQGTPLGRILGSGAAEPPLAEGAPGLELDIVQAAVLQGFAPLPGPFALIVVETGAVIDPVMFEQTHLQLVDQDRVGQLPLQQRHLAAVHVGNPEMTHLATELQP